ncbi:MAG: hypothetical protein JWO52_451 [Gammaproteobacteria bacterium]|jgi:hypothetical protein|nr:hypothetical protein [Gammaproteobacteria bacterium]
MTPMDEARRIVRFRGGVSCRRDEGPLGLILIGRTTDQPNETATLAFAASAPSGLPEALEDATVEQIDAGRYRIWTGRREWIFPARSAHLHREVSTIFYRAITPRLVPWSKRVFWHVVLAMASSQVGKRLLWVLRRR